MAQASQQLLTGYGQSPFTSSWKTDNAGTSSSTQITVPTIITGTYNCVVYWGDGNASTMTTYNDAAWTHTYGVAGTYTVKIYGTFVGIRFANGGDRLKLLNISNWGILKLGVNEGSYFRGCSNLTITALDVLNMTGVAAMDNAFNGCSSITTIPSINSWRFAAVTTMLNMLANCANFNQALIINCAACISFNGMFSSCPQFNSSITFSNTSLVTNMGSMFSGCSLFNQSVSSLNTSNVTSMQSTFNGCGAFNQSVSTFNTAKVSNMSGMFQSATVWNQDISGFNIAALTNATSMCSSSAFNITNYNLLLDSATGWPSQSTINNGVTFSAGSAHYSGTNAINGRATLATTHSWTITDGGTP